jgi:hypothetical protein
MDLCINTVCWEPCGKRDQGHTGAVMVVMMQDGWANLDGCLQHQWQTDQTFIILLVIIHPINYYCSWFVVGYCLLINILELSIGDQLINFHYLSLVMYFFAHKSLFHFSPCWAQWEKLAMCFSNEEERTSLQQNTVCNFCHVSKAALEPMLRLSVPWQRPWLMNTGRHWLLGMENWFEMWNQPLPWKSWIPWPSLYAQWQHAPVNF